MAPRYEAGSCRAGQPCRHTGARVAARSAPRCDRHPRPPPRRGAACGRAPAAYKAAMGQHYCP